MPCSLQLKREQRLTAKELAARLGVSLNAVRHHLKELEAEGWSSTSASTAAWARRRSPTG